MQGTQHLPNLTRGVVAAFVRPHRATRYGIAVVLSAVCFGARLGLDPWLQNSEPFAFFYVAIAMATAFGGVGPGVLAFLLAAPLAEYFFVEPRHAFGDLRAGSPSLLLLAVHLVIGSSLIGLVAYFRRVRARTAAAVSELAETNSLLTVSMDAADQGCIEWEAASGVLKLSPRAAALHGIPGQREITLDDFEKLISASEGTHVRQALQSALAQDDLRLDYRIDAAGGFQWLRIRARVIPDPAPRRVIGIVTNVTEDHRLMAVLHDKHALLEAVFSSADVGLCLADETGHFIRVNPSFARMLEYSEHELVGMHYSRLIPPQDRGAVEQIRLSHLAGAGESREFPSLTKGGRLRYMRVSGSRLVTSGGRTMLLSVVSDITEVRQWMLALQESEQRFRVLADNSPLPIWVTNAQGRIDFVNQRYVQFFGCSAEAARKQGWEPLLHPEERDHYLGAFKDAMRRHAAFRAQARVRDARGDWRWVDSHGLPRFGSGGEYLGHVGCSPDITDVKKAEEALHRLNTDLENRVSERTARLKETVAELEAFSYSLAHDLRSPLLAMRGYADVLLESHSAQLAPEAQHHLRRISVAAHRLDELIRDVMNYSQILRGEMPIGPVNVAHLLNEVIERYPDLRARRESISIAENLPFVLANHAGLSQAFACLLDNALKFVAPDVPPAVRVLATPGKSSRVGGVTPWGSVRIVVQDNGIGIDGVSAQRLFKMFQRLHREGAYAGSGMGLAIARKAVERMGGEIGLNSSPGHGSRFWIELPLHQAAADKTSAPAQQTI